MSQLLETRSGVAIASGKLPDDLDLYEFNHLTRALGVVLRPRRVEEAGPGALTVMKVQYGSDFMFILSVASSLVGLTLSVAKALDVLAAAGLKNEDRLAKRSDRLRRNGNVSSAEETARDYRSYQRDETVRFADLDEEVRREQAARIGVPDYGTTEQWRLVPISATDRDKLRALPDLFDPNKGAEILAALTTLADYGIRLEVREE